jgi:hypothetical protein
MEAQADASGIDCINVINALTGGRIRNRSVQVGRIRGPRAIAVEAAMSWLMQQTHFRSATRSGSGHDQAQRASASGAPERALHRPGACRS